MKSWNVEKGSQSDVRNTDWWASWQWWQWDDAGSCEMLTFYLYTSYPLSLPLSLSLSLSLWVVRLFFVSLSLSLSLTHTLVRLFFVSFFAFSKLDFLYLKASTIFLTKSNYYKILKFIIKFNLLNTHFCDLLLSCLCFLSFFFNYVWSWY